MSLSTKAIIAAAIKSHCYETVAEEMEKFPGQIRNSSPVIGCKGGIEQHTDEMFPPYSAFIVLKNDGCLVWQRNGYRGTPKVGDRFVLHIHQTHGIRAKAGHDFIALFADGQTPSTAERNLRKECRELVSWGSQ